jgi:hypothetical protein
MRRQNPGGGSRKARPLDNQKPGGVIMHILHVNFESKKDTWQGTRWLIEQDAPFPHLEAYAGKMNLRGDPELLDAFRVSLLRSDFQEDAFQKSRSDFAGFDGNPGELVYRGKELGELSLYCLLTKRNDGTYHVTLSRNRVVKYLTPSAKKWIMNTLENLLVDYIIANRKSLRDEAIAEMEKFFEKQCKELEKFFEKQRKELEQSLEECREKFKASIEKLKSA